MRGKTEAAIAYGFKSDINFKYDPKNPGYDYCVTGYPGQPVYCGIVLKSKSITKAMDEIK